MYVCICNAVTDKQIRAEAREGCCSLRDLAKRTGCGTSCGKCARHAREILVEEMQRLGVQDGVRERETAPSRPVVVNAGMTPQTA